MALMDFIAKFSLPTEMVYGIGSSAKVGEEARRLGASKVFFVTDAGVAKSGILAEAMASLERADLPYVLYDQAPGDPDTNDIDQVAAQIRNYGCNFVVAAGGGSAMCTGKAAAVVANNPGHTVNYLGSDKFPNAPLTCIAMPTTAGSGSEVSKHTTLTHGETKRKTGIDGYRTAPRVAILDPLLLRSVPRGQAIASGVDAFTHALEAYVSTRATRFTDIIALDSLSTIAANLPLSIYSDSLEARCKMSLASSMANVACGNAGLGLVHAINGAITHVFKARNYPPIPYGLLHAILLPPVLEFNCIAAEDKFARVAVEMGANAVGKRQRELARECIAKVKEMLALLNAPRRLPWEKLAPEHADEIVEETMERPRPNTRKYDRNDVLLIVEKAMQGWEI